MGRTNAKIFIVIIIIIGLLGLAARSWINAIKKE